MGMTTSGTRFVLIGGRVGRADVTEDEDDVEAIVGAEGAGVGVAEELKLVVVEGAGVVNEG